MTRRRVWLLIALGLAGALLGGWCLLPERLAIPTQPRTDGSAALSLGPGHPLGQTFAAHHGGLAGIEFFIHLDEGSAPTITLHLRVDPASSDDLVAVALELPPAAGPAFYGFAFPAQAGSRGRSYYAFLEAEEPGASLALAPATAYLEGAAYQDHLPLEAQTAFRLVYAPEQAVRAALGAALRWLVLLAAAIWLFVLPGWALLDGLRERRGLRWPETLSLAAGLGLALPPILLLWTDQVNLHAGSLHAWLPGALALAWLSRHLFRRRTLLQARRNTGTLAPPPAGKTRTVLASDLALLAVLALTLTVRLVVVGTLDAPLWGDSYQHAVMAQLIVDRAGLPNSWHPYAPYSSYGVHYGFPAAVAFLDWLTGWGATQATLWAGQIINALAALTAYPLATRLARGDRWAGVGAVLVAGLLSSMPAYYVNWGRYAQLTGLAILPAALWLMWESAESDRAWPAVGLAALAASGMLLAYYRMAFFYALFVPAWLLTWALPRWGISRHGTAGPSTMPPHPWPRALLRLALLALATCLLVLPRMPQVVSGRLDEGLARGATVKAALEAVRNDYRVWLHVGDYAAPWLLGLVLLGLVWGLARRRWELACIPLWVAALAAVVAGRLVRLPGANLMQGFAVVISLYLPVALLVGWLLGEIGHWLGQLRQAEAWGRATQWAIALAVIALALAGSPGLTRIVDPFYMLVTRPDVQAMAWIRDHTSPDSRFLVESFLAFNGWSAAGSDAGWWIPLLAGRQTTLPPQYPMWTETPDEPGYDRRVVELVRRLQANPPATADGMAVLCEWDVTHVYVGQRQGLAGYPDQVSQLFAPADLAASPAFQTLYHQDLVWVFAFDRSRCASPLQGWPGPAVSAAGGMRDS